MGNNSQGRLGVGDKRLDNSSVPRLVESLSKEKIVIIACGKGHSAAISNNGDVYMWGMGGFGALGNGDIETKYEPRRIDYFYGNRIQIVNASCGDKHSVFIDGSFNLN